MARSCLSCAQRVLTSAHSCVQLLGMGMTCAGIRSELEPAMNVIGEYLNGEKPATNTMKVRAFTHRPCRSRQRGA